MKTKKAILCALLAAVLYAIHSPLSKLLLAEVSATMMAAFLYLGAGLGLFAVGVVRRICGRKEKEQPLTKRELPYTVGMILLDIAAPIFLMIGLSKTTAANASLLNNFEIVATSVIALVVFKEAISAKLWTAIALVVISSMILSFEDLSSFSFSYGSLFVLAACVCWGFENNCTRKLSAKNPLEIVVIKGFGSGLGALVVAFVVGESLPYWGYIVCALLVGFVSYGLSIYFYIYAQRDLGAAKTSTYYAVAPFVGAGLSLLIFWELPSLSFVIALTIMAAGTWLATVDSQ
ncbi:MAG: DMT family transporter [Clostridia bacterium]|nr:DMT family transporter [Clostridia bacterium]